MSDISWIIPVISRDIIYLPGMVAAIKLQTLAPRELIVVSSGLSAVEKSKVDELLASLEIKANHFARRILHTAGRNRNYGATRATSSYLSFVDADDIPYPRRNELLVEAIQRESREGSELVILHGFRKMPRDIWSPQETDLPFDYHEVEQRSPRLLAELETSCLRKILVAAALPQSRRPLIGLEFLEAEFSPAHGPVTLPRAIFRRNRFAWRPLGRGQDVLFLNVLASLPGVHFCFIDHPLLVYRNGWENENKAFSEFSWNHPNPLFRGVIRFRLALKGKLRQGLLLLSALRRRLS